MESTSKYAYGAVSKDTAPDEFELDKITDKPERHELEQSYCTIAMKETAKGLLFLNGGLLTYGFAVYNLVTCVDQNCTSENASITDPTCAYNFSNSSDTDFSGVSCAVGSALLFGTATLLIGKSLVNFCYGTRIRSRHLDN